MLPSTRERVPAHTSKSAARRIQQQLVTSLRYHDAHPDKIENRLRELDREWDIERTIEMNASALAFAGIALGSVHDKRWLALSALVTGFLFQHAVQGWCPPIPVLRSLGFRTVYEIEAERYALKALRGDFERVPTGRRTARAKNGRASAAKRAVKRAA